jgi:hypothetical protein
VNCHVGVAVQRGRLPRHFHRLVVAIHGAALKQLARCCGPREVPVRLHTMRARHHVHM